MKIKKKAKGKEKKDQRSAPRRVNDEGQNSKSGDLAESAEYGGLPARDLKKNLGCA
jgi:hypothetical protein